VRGANGVLTVRTSLDGCYASRLLASAVFRCERTPIHASPHRDSRYSLTLCRFRAQCFTVFISHARTPLRSCIFHCAPSAAECRSARTAGHQALITGSTLCAQLCALVSINLQVVDTCVVLPLPGVPPWRTPADSADLPACALEISASDRPSQEPSADV
jgi:hypothetical protein